MKALLALTAVAALFFVPISHSSAAPILFNGDLSGGAAGWHGDGHLVYLNPDGTESDDASSSGIPVLKLHLSGESAFVYQEYDTPTSPTTQNISIDVMAASDFKRSTDDSLYTVKWGSGSTWYWTALQVPNADFWIRGIGTDAMWYYKISPALKPGVWTTLQAHFENLAPSETHTVYFCVPPGDGSVYIKNAVVAP